MSVDWLEVTLEHDPDALSRKATVPPTPRTAIQYVVPWAIDAEPSVNVFHAPLAGEDPEPLTRSEPGRPETFVYRPTAMLVALFDASTYRLSVPVVPDALATNGNASDWPASLLSTLLSTD